MAQRPQSPHEQYPEVVVPQAAPLFNVYDSSWEHYMPEESPAPEYPPQASPAPEYPPQRSPAPSYQPYSPGRSLISPSPNLSASSPPPPGSGITFSPSNSDRGWGDTLRTPPLTYSEFQSPDPEIVPRKPLPRYMNEKAVPSSDPETVHHSFGKTISDDKEYVEKSGVVTTIEPSHTIKRKPLPPQPIVEEVQKPKKRPIYKRPLWIIAALIALVIIAVAVVCGVIFGRKSNQSSQPSSPTSTPANAPFVLTGNPDTDVGGYLHPSFYSKVGAWNGSGIAVAAANPGVDRTTYVFYQDYQGNLTYKLIDDEGRVSDDYAFGLINDKSARPLNGTPISIVNHMPTPGNLVYHLFYIDQGYNMVERILQTNPKSNQGSAIPKWTDGPLKTAGLPKTLQANSIGMQACYYGNYYGNYNVSNKYATDAIQLWFATTETKFEQWSWTNGTTSWVKDQDWNGYSGHAGVGCQTWDSWMLEYVFFVDTNQKIAAFWRDNNRTASANTPSHPTLTWNKIPNINITNVHKASSLGYTNYMIYQHQDHSIRGANISWAAENTTIVTSPTTGMQDVFTVEDRNSNNPVAAIGGTHLTITAVKTSSGGAELQVYLQQDGNEVRQYTRDQQQVNGKWAGGLKVV